MQDCGREESWPEAQARRPCPAAERPYGGSEKPTLLAPDDDAF
jgi:hypothetical protein